MKQKKSKQKQNGIKHTNSKTQNEIKQNIAKQASIQTHQIILMRRTHKNIELLR